MAVHLLIVTSVALIERQSRVAKPAWGRLEA
jgi:hypothetical protein